MRHEMRRYAPILALVLIAPAIVRLLAPGWSTTTSQLFTLGTIWAISALGQTLAMGVGGIVTFGQAAFSAIGAFTYAYLVANRHMNVGAAVVAAVVICMVVALVVGLLVLRLRGYVLSVGTLGIFLAVQNLLPSQTWLSGGYSGRPIPPIIESVATQDWVYALLTIGLIAFVHLVVTSRRGRAVIAVRDDEAAGMSLGLSVFRIHLAVFTVAAGISALGGILFAAQIGYVQPNAFDLSFLSAIFVVAVVGGLRSVWGPIPGAVVYVILEHYTQNLGNKAGLIYALVFLGVVLVVPGGITEIIRQIYLKLRGRGGEGRPWTFGGRPSWFRSDIYLNEGAQHEPVASTAKSPPRGTKAAPLWKTTVGWLKAGDDL